MNITTKTTKAELQNLLQEAHDELDLLRDAYYTAQPITTSQLQLTWQTVRREFTALARDVYNAGALCRRTLDKVRLSVNN